MIKIEGDYQHINVTTMQETQYINGLSTPVIKVHISLLQQTQNLLSRLELMEREWQATKVLIDKNPAVRASYEQFQQMCAVAKEYT